MVRNKTGMSLEQVWCERFLKISDVDIRVTAEGSESVVS